MTVLQDINDACGDARGALNQVLDSMAVSAYVMSKEVTALERFGLVEIGSAIVIANREVGELHRLAAGFVDRIEAAQKALHAAQDVADTKAAVLAHLSANSVDLTRMKRELEEFGDAVEKTREDMSARLTVLAELPTLVKQLADASTNTGTAREALARVVSQNDDGIDEVERLG